MLIVKPSVLDLSEPRPLASSKHAHKGPRSTTLTALPSPSGSERTTFVAH